MNLGGMKKYTQAQCTVLCALIYTWLHMNVAAVAISVGSYGKQGGLVGLKLLAKLAFFAFLSLLESRLSENEGCLIFQPQQPLLIHKSNMVAKYSSNFIFWHLEMMFL